MIAILKSVIFDFDLTLVNLNIDDRVLVSAIKDDYIEGGVPHDLLDRCTDPYTMVREIPEKIDNLPRCKINAIQNKVLTRMTKSELIFLDKAVLFPGTKEVLKEIKAQGKKIGVVSSNSLRMINGVSKKFSLSNLIDVVIGRESPGKPKPHQDKILLCLKMLKCEPDEGILVGDRAEDIIAGKKAGLYAIGVLTGSHSREQLTDAGADEILNDVSQLPRTIERLKIFKG